MLRESQLRNKTARAKMGGKKKFSPDDFGFFNGQLGNPLTTESPGSSQ